MPCPFTPPYSAVLYESKVATHGRRQHRSHISKENIRKFLEFPDDIDHSRVSRLVNNSELACLNKAEKKAYIQRVKGPPRDLRTQEKGNQESSVCLETYYPSRRDHSEEGLIDLGAYKDNWGKPGDSESDEDQCDKAQLSKWPL